MLFGLASENTRRCFSIYIRNSKWRSAIIPYKNYSINIVKTGGYIVNRFCTKGYLLLGGVNIGILWKKTYYAACSHHQLSISIPKEEEHKQFKWGKLLKLLVSEIWLIIGSLAAALLAAYLNVKIPLCLGEFINVMSDGLRNSQQFVLDSVNKPALSLLTLYLSQAACTFAYISLLSYMGENIAAKLKLTLFETIIRQDIAFFDDIRTSNLVDCLTNDVQEFKSTFKQLISQGIKDMAQISGGFVSLFVISPTMTLSVLLLVPTIIVIGTTFGAILRRLSAKAQSQSLQATSLFEEVISNIRTVRAFANEDKECSQFQKHLNESKRLNSLLGCGIGVFQAGTNIFLNALVLGTLYLGCHLLTMYEIRPGDLMSFMVATQIIQRSFSHLSLLFGHSIKGKEALERIFYFCSLEPKIPVKGGKIISANEFIPSIKFEEVYFSYPTRPTQLVLHDLNLVIPAGKTVAVVGTSGNGKTTLANLVERYYDVDKGRILIGGVDITKLDPSWLRGSIIGIINQEPNLLATTVMENIRYGEPTATDEEVYEAAKQANADEFIRSFPDGYNTVLGERGITVSGGQKQRIAIARALIKKPSILILDEATSALDPESEKIVQKTLEGITHGKTVLIIAHRLTTVQNADIIVVLNKGEIVEIGSHKELCAKKGFYWELMNQPQNRSV